MPVTSLPHELESEQSRQSEIDRRRGRIVPWVIIAFYMTFMTALIGFVVIAYQHPPNEVTPEAYEKGLAYNDTLEKSAEQVRLGWSSRVAWTKQGLAFSLRDRQGKPVVADTVRAWFVHPDKAALDRSVSLHVTSPGQYRALINLPARGLWTVHITVQSGKQQYQTVSQFQAD